MFTKTIITLCAALTLATSLVSVADAQSRQPMPSFTAGERLWFSIPEGREDHLPR
jgi:hypothetical protein